MKTLYELSLSWVNTKFRWHGYTRFGCDCFGLIIGVLYESKIIDEFFLKKFKQYRYGNNLSKINIHKMFKELSCYFEETNNLKESDIIIIECKNSPIHFIIYEKGQENGKTIQITQNVGFVYKSNFDEKLKIKKMFKLKS